MKERKSFQPKRVRHEHGYIKSWQETRRARERNRIATRSLTSAVIRLIDFLDTHLPPEIAAIYKEEFATVISGKTRLFYHSMHPTTRENSLRNAGEGLHKDFTETTEDKLIE